MGRSANEIAQATQAQTLGNAQVKKATEEKIQMTSFVHPRSIFPITEAGDTSWPKP